jgi:predicted ferric reductase
VKLWWYVARASGVVAWVLLGASVIWGILLTTRIMGSKPRPAWLLDLHRWLGGLAVTFTAIHLAGLVLDDYVEFGAADLLIPFASEWRPAAVAWGVVGFYLLAAVQTTSLMMKRLPRRVWRWIHSASFVLFFVATIHAGMAGSDVANPAYRVLTIGMVVAVVFFTIYRVMAAAKPMAPVRRSPPAERPADVVAG